jgi:hypothetical protein
MDHSRVNIQKLDLSPFINTHGKLKSRALEQMALIPENCVAATDDILSASSQ